MEETEERQPVWTYQDLGLLLGMAVPSVLFAAVLTKLLLLWMPQRGVVAAIAQVAIYAGVMGSMFLLLKLRYGLPFWESMAWRIPWRNMALTAFLGPVLAVSLALFAVLLDMRGGSMALDDLMRDRWSMIAIGVAATTIGPVFEEILFRGFAQPLLVKSLGLMGGLIATSLPFSLLHGPQYNWNWQRLLMLTLASMAFGLVRHRTGSTAASTLMHAAYNLTGVAGLVFQGNKLNLP